MGFRKRIFPVLILSMVGLASAQISGGAGSFQGIMPLISNILGLDLGNPNAIIGLLATIAVMNVATYVILKIGVKKFDSSHGSSRNNPLSEAVGLDSEESRNILAILSTLVTLSIFGSGAAAGLISGFQSMFILGFTFLLLAGLVFVLFGGTGLIFGGGSYAAGKSMKATAKGVQEGSEAFEQAGQILDTAEEQEAEVEEEVEDIESKEEQDEEEISLGDESPDEAERHIQVEISEIQDAFQTLGNVERELDRIEESLLDEDKDLAKEEQEVEQLINQASDLEEKTDNSLSTIHDTFQSLSEHPEWFESEEDLDLPKKVDDGITIDWDKLAQEFASSEDAAEGLEAGLVQPLRNVIEWEKEEFNEIKKAVKEMNDVYVKLSAERKLLQRLENDLKTLMKELEALKKEYDEEGDIIEEVEVLAKKSGDEEDFEKLRQRDEPKLEQMNENLQKIVKQQEKLEERMSGLRDKFDEEYGKEEKIINWFEQIHQHLQGTEENLQSIRSEFENYEDVLSNPGTLAAEELADIDNLNEEQARELVEEDMQQQGENPEFAGINSEDIQALKHSESFEHVMRIIIPKILDDTRKPLRAVDESRQLAQEFLDKTESEDH